MRTEFKCGHYTGCSFYDSLTISEKKDYIKWKYSVGVAGTRDKCFDCFRKEGV